MLWLSVLVREVGYRLEGDVRHVGSDGGVNKQHNNGRNSAADAQPCQDILRNRRAEKTPPASELPHCDYCSLPLCSSVNCTWPPNMFRTGVRRFATSARRYADTLPQDISKIEASHGHLIEISKAQRIANRGFVDGKPIFICHCSFFLRVPQGVSARTELTMVCSYWQNTPHPSQ